MLFSVFKVGKCECSKYIPSLYALFICERAWKVLVNYQNFTYHFELHLHVQILDWTMVDLVSRFHHEIQRIPFETVSLRILFSSQVIDYSMCQKFKLLESCELWISDTMINYLLFQKLKLLGNNKFNYNSNNI